jgi:polyisoprenoid-binding protein YceI
MKKQTLVVFIATFFIASCMSLVFAKTEFQKIPKGSYQVDLSHASIVWKVSHFGLSNYVGRFAKFDASIDYNPDDIESSVVTAKIDPMSIQTAYPNPEEKDFDKVLATESGWFNAGKFASIDFTSTSIEMVTDSTAVMQGNLTLLGVSKPVTLDVTFNGAMLRQPFSGLPTMGFSAVAKLDRTEWGLSKYAPNVGAEVTVMIEGEFYKADD